jgi:hypothetical protein
MINETNMIAKLDSGRGHGALPIATNGYSFIAGKTLLACKQSEVAA